MTPRNKTEHKPDRKTDACKNIQQLDAVNNRIELEKDDWRLRLVCCDCGLTHLLAFAIEDNGNLGIAIDRESDAPLKFQQAYIRYSCGCGGSLKVKVDVINENTIQLDLESRCEKCGELFRHFNVRFD